MDKKIFLSAMLGGFLGAFVGSLLWSGLSSINFSKKRSRPQKPVFSLPPPAPPRTFKDAGQVTILWKPCENEIKTHCAEVLMTKKDMHACLIPHKKNLGKECRERLTKQDPNGVELRN